MSDRLKWTWFRMERSPYLEGATLDLDGLGIEQVNDWPLYDNGTYVVVDTVRDLEFTILDRTGKGVKKVLLDKYEAFRVADELQEADERHGRSAQGATE